MTTNTKAKTRTKTKIAFDETLHSFNHNLGALVHRTRMLNEIFGDLMRRAEADPVLASIYVREARERLSSIPPYQPEAEVA
ncbi:MAG: hypothetical protein ACSLE1_15895 [Sphingobium sp.]